MHYYNFRKTLSGKPSIYPDTQSVEELVTGLDIDCYRSLFDFNESQKTAIEQNNSLAGIRDTTTNRLLFDFDNKADVEAAKRDTKELLNRLQEQGVSESSFNIYFTGSKGFHVEVLLAERISQPMFCNAVDLFAKDFPTFDVKIRDAVRMVRVVNTRHPDTGLYKIPLRLKHLDQSVEKIREWAKAPRIIPAATVGASLKFELPAPKEKKLVTSTINWNSKPKFLTNCKFSLQNGHFKEGNRSSAFLCLASTYKNQGFLFEQNFAFLKATAELQAQLNDSDEFPEDELRSILTQVYKETWQGGTFTCRERGWLQDYCNTLGSHSCSNVVLKDSTIGISNVSGLFTNYVEDLETNVLYSGIPSLDKRAKLLVGTSNGLLAPPGVGKTSLALQWLNHNSNQDVSSIFFSYDMFHSALYMRMLQRHTGYDQNRITQIFRSPGPEKDKLIKIIEQEYKNVSFCFKSGQSADDIELTIDKTEQKTGKKVKLIVVDYNELVMSDISDTTASSAQVAQRLRQIANDKAVAILTLLQPAKQYSSPASEIVSFNAAKGSASIAQSLTLMLGCSRPGFNPLDSSTDKYFNVTCLKNRNGELFSLDYQWSGVSGVIKELDDVSRSELRGIREARDAKKEDENW